MPNGISDTDIDYGDKVWNYVYGCLHGCPYCYARQMIEEGRLHARHESFAPDFRPSRLPGGRWTPKKDFRSVNFRLPPGRAMVLVNFMGDMFGEWVPPDWVLNGLRQMKKTNEYVFLTKNPTRYQDFWFPGNSWLGTTIEGPGPMQAERMEAMFKTPRRAVRWLSVEPYLRRFTPEMLRQLKNFDWVTVGACTGKRPHAFQPPVEWIDEMVNVCLASQVPVFVKDNVKAIKEKTGIYRDFPRRM